MLLSASHGRNYDRNKSNLLKRKMDILRRQDAKDCKGQWEWTRRHCNGGKRRFTINQVTWKA